MLKYDGEQQFTVEPNFLNRTRIYLYPAVVMMKSYRPYLAALRENLLCVSYKDESIVLYYDRKNTQAIKALIEGLKQNTEYIDDWMHNEKSYAVQIKLDLNYSAFEEGRYSDIYSKSQINRTFTPDSKTKKVLVKDPEYKQSFVDLLNEWFNTHNTIEFLESRINGKKVEISQYDIPPCMNQEIYNYDERRTIKTGRIKSS
jgi:hypothetical protein